MGLVCACAFARERDLEVVFAYVGCAFVVEVVFVFIIAMVIEDDVFVIEDNDGLAVLEPFSIYFLLEKTQVACEVLVCFVNVLD